MKLIRLIERRSADKHRIGLFRCACGNTREVVASHVRNGYTRSCGCLVNSPAIVAKWTTHGMHGTPTYSSWQAMKRRCENPQDKDYADYGASGIAVCSQWSSSFDAFLADMGVRPSGTSIDRIDGTKGYLPDNCRWATPIQQNRNRVSFVIVKTPAGIMPLVDYASHIGITRGAAHLRLKRGKLFGCVKI